MQDCPGIAPRAFSRLFELAEENKARQQLQVHCYMLELYNDKLIDLLRDNDNQEASTALACVLCVP